MSEGSPPDRNPSSLTEKTSRGVVWGVAGALGYQLYALVIQTALTYLLSKAQYGAYGKAFALVSLSMLLQQAGFNEVLLRRPKKLRLWGPQVGWLALALGLAGTTLLLAAAAPTAILYRDPELRDLILLASPLPLIRSMGVVPTLEMIDAMRFRLYYGLIMVNAVAALSLTLALAIVGLGERSFVVSTLITEPFYVAILWRFAAIRLTGYPRPARWTVLAGKLKFVLGANAARFARSSVDPLILGLFATPSAVGIYFYAQSMVGQIVRVVTLNLSGVLLPALNKIENDPVRQTAAFLRAARVLALVGIPMCIGLGAVAALFVGVFLDDAKWHELPPVIAALALATAFRLLDEPTQSLLSAQGRFRIGFRTSVASAVLYCTVCAVGSVRGRPLDTAFAVAGYYAVAGPALLAIAIRFGGRGIVDALKVFLIPLVLSTAAILPWLLLDFWVPAGGRSRDAAVLCAVICGSVVTYLLLGRWFEPAGWHELITKLQLSVPRPLRFLAQPLGAALRKS
jgi:PST family polysaccharide transporter